MSKCEAYFSEIGVDLKFKALRHHQPVTRTAPDEKIILLKNAYYYKIMTGFFPRGRTIHQNYAEAELGPWDYWNARLICHEVGHMLGKKHGWGIMISGDWNMILWPLTGLDFATGFSEGE